VADGDGHVVFCIDPYEVHVDTERGDGQCNDDEVPAGATAASLADLTPTILIRFETAAQVCTNTPVFDGDGQLAGFKRMPTRDEWEDAADGVLGSGGSIFPYGDQLDASRCATLDGQGQQVYDDLQPTGSLPGCVSAFGVYDQCGNAWEWADTGIDIDIAGWWPFAEAYGIPVVVDDLDLLILEDPTTVHLLTHTVIEAQPPALEVDAQGYLFVPADSVADTGACGHTGYLKVNVDDSSYRRDENFLPVELRPYNGLDGSLQYRLLLRREEDGDRVPDKRGGAYYNDPEYTCQSFGSHPEHVPSFEGTITFRCVADPLPEG